MCLILIFTPLFLTGCSEESSEINSNRFYTLYYNDEIILVDKETKVMYLWVKKGYGAGLTVMLDVDGKPLIYDGEF